MRAAFSGIGYGSVLTSGLPSQPAISQCFAQVTIPGNAAGAPPPPPNPPFTPPPPPPSLFDVIPQRSFATTASAHIQQPYGMKVETTSYWSTAGSFYDVGSMMHHPIPNAANGLPPTAEQRHLESNFGGQYCGSNAVTASFGQVPSLSCPQFGGNLQVIANSYSEFTNIIDPPPPPPVFDAPTSSEATVDRFTSQQYYEETSDGGDGYYADHYTDYCANSSKNSKRSPEELTMKESAASSAAKRKTLRKRKRSLRTVAAPAAEPAGFHEAREPAAHHSEEELHLRSRSQFTGRVYKLPENCRRPQTSAGRTFPLKARVDYAIAYDGDGPEFSNRNRQKYLYDSVTSVLEAHRKKDAWLSGCAASSDSALVIRTATKLVRKVPSSLLESNRSPARRGPALGQDTAAASSSRGASPFAKSGSRFVSTMGAVVSSDLKTASVMAESSVKNSSNLKRVVSNGTLSRNGMSWRRRRTNEGLEDNGENTGTPATTDVAAHTNAININRSLRRINDRFYTGESNVCFEFAASGSCTAGVLCMYDHSDSSEHRTAKICAKMLLGQCRFTDCNYAHTLAPHQMPVCHFFLSLNCIEEHCPYLHVKHADHAQVCAKFRRGICKLGDECAFPHRYLSKFVNLRGDPPIATKHKRLYIAARALREKEERDWEESSKSLKWVD